MGDIVNFTDRRAALRRRALLGKLKLVPKVEETFRALALFEPTSPAAPDGAANDADGDEGR